MTFQELQKDSGEARLISYCFENQQICVKLKLYSEKVVTFKATTSLVVANHTDLELKKDLSRLCFVHLVRFSDVLLHEKGYYVPNPNFGKFMQEINQNLHLGYGLKHDFHFHLITLKGYRNLISFVTNQLDAIEIIEEE